jgi:hypothetical protein
MNNTNILSNVETIKKLKFIHVTKTGGTAIEELGNIHNIKWGRLDQDINTLTSHLCYIKDRAFWHTPTIYYDTEILKKNKKTFDFFLIVRNPYERVISEFYCKWGGYKSKNCENKYKLQITETSSNKDINKWMTHTLTDLSKLLKSNIYLSSGHWVPQYLYIFNAYGKKIVKNNNIIHFENIGNELDKLFSRYNMDISYSQAPLINVNKKSFAIENLSKKNINLINEIYKNDFELFGYPMI